MHLRSARHLPDTVLSLEIDDLCANDRGNGAQLLVHLAEFDRRKLYLPAGYPSMFQYCIQHCRMSEDVAYRRIRVSRAARHHPDVIPAIADGRLNLNVVVLLAPHLRGAQGRKLLREAENQTRSSVELLIARAFPKPDIPTKIVPVTPVTENGTTFQLAARPVFDICQQPAAASTATLLPDVATVAADIEPPPRIAPLSPESFELHTTIDRETRDDLVRAQELLGQVSRKQIPVALKRALRLLVVELEKQKLGATVHPQASRRQSGDSRHIPSAVKRDVRRRDKDCCTFVGDSGHRCEERAGLEFDHIVPVARGGTATVENIRLRCPGHNQLEAERVFGAQFMESKRGLARERGVARKTG